MPSKFIPQQNIQDIEYYKYNDVNEWYKALNTRTTCLQIIHINVCSLRLHFSGLLVLLNTCLQCLDVVCLTEINIKDHETHRYQINGYNMYSWTRNNRRGGGILLYVRKEITFIVKKVHSKYCEVLAGELQLKNYQTSLFVIYRPPDQSKANFITELQSILCSVSRRKNLILIGDININILERDIETISHRYLNTLSELGLQCGLRDITRECVTAGRYVASCIDHVFVRTDKVTNTIQTYTVTSRLADHYIIGLTMEFRVDIRLVNKISKLALNNRMTCEKLQCINWTEFMFINDPIELYLNIVKIFQNIYMTCTFQRPSDDKRGTQLWVTSYLQQQIRKKDSLFRKWKSRPNNNNYRLEYTKQRNYTNKLINRARNEHRKLNLIKCKGDMRKIWSHINGWLGRNNLSIDNVVERYMLNTNANSTKQVCDGFCDTFTTEIDKIKSQHICSELFLNRDSYVNECNVSFRFMKVSPIQVVKVIDSMDCSKTPGSDGIRLTDLKEIKNKIAPVIAHFINLSIEKGTYPDELKLAIIRPIYKQGPHEQFTNYRPIAILNVINKIVEKIIMTQITKFIEQNKIFTDVQHGFRPNRSTTTILSKFSDDLNKSLNDKKIVFAVFIDFKKAFETLDHDGLLQSMQECGIRGPMYTWFREYLRNRKLKVRVCGTESKIGDIKFGVPTGSVYGPVGYLMHVNSMPNVIKNCNIYMYADDTCIMYSGTDQYSIQKAVQQDFDNLVRWSHDNGIIINLNKTKCMAILSPYNKNKIINIHIIGHEYECLHRYMKDCKCNRLVNVTYYKYLGLTINNNFSWRCQVDNVCNKLRLILSKLQHLQFIVNKGIMYLLYYALADSVISYGLGAYGLTFPSYLDKIKNLQIRLLKLLVDEKVKKSLNKEYDKLFKICKILPIESKVKITILCEQFHDNKHKKYREYTHPTRSSKKPKFIVPKVNNYYGRRERRWVTPVLLNELPCDLQTGLENKNQLKNKLRKHYLSLCP